MITQEPPVASTSDPRWRALTTRDAAADDRFVYGVASTGVYCRPTCPSRRPRPSVVSFFDTADDAERAGFRACRRCLPRDAASPLRLKVDRARAWIEQHPDVTPSLATLARVARTTPWHLHRSFKRLTGLTPREYVAARRTTRIKRELKRRSVTDAIYEAGFGSPSRLYEEADATLGMTPGAYRLGGTGEQIRFALASTPLGALLVAVTGRGVCHVSLGEAAGPLEHQLAQEFPNALLERDDRGLADVVLAFQALIDGRPPSSPLPLDVQATAFQRRVWRALQQIPAGETRTYSDVARSIGHATAARAVARACATNPVALAVPCHRVVPAGGGVGQYRWGSERKAKLLENERKTIG